MASTGTPRKGASKDSGIADRLLAWYDAHHRELPWRVSPGAFASGTRPHPYHVWLSEIMLQQTTVEAVKPYFRKFLEKWPRVTDLAAAQSEEVMTAWAGLGYYSRARNLKKCADLVASEMAGLFPDNEVGLRALPGVGAYTAAAIAAIAFGRQSIVIDGNVERVMARLFEIRTPLPEAKPEIRAVLAPLVPEHRPGDFAQAMMDLGATICTPRRPRCMLCPLRGDCQAIISGDPELLPVKAGKADKPARRGAAFVAVRPDNTILLRQRMETGLLGGMTEVSTTDWTARRDGDTTAAAAPLRGEWRRTGAVRHVFTHFSLDLEVYRADVPEHTAAPAGSWWARIDALHDEALPTLMKKVIESAIPGATKRKPVKGPA